MTGNETGLERSPETPLTLDGFSRSEHSPVPTFIPTHSPAWLGLHIATGSKGRALSRAGLSVLLNLINPRLFFFFFIFKTTSMLSYNFFLYVSNFAENLYLTLYSGAPNVNVKIIFQPWTSALNK